MFTSLRRIIRIGFIGFWRNAFVSLSAIFIITITLTVVGASMLVGQLLHTALAQVSDKVDINVYLRPDASITGIDELKHAIETLPDVKEVIYVSREDALANFQERHKNDESIMRSVEELDDNPLGASFSIRAKETSQYESIATFLDERHAAEPADAPLIDRINFNQNKKTIDRLTEIINTVEGVSSLSLIILMVVSTLIAFNTIRLAIYTAREEIGVMRLVGASNMFIRGPFVLQGVMYGVVSGILALLILYPIVLKFGPGTEAFFSLNIFNYFVSNFGYLFFVIVGSGIILGVVSSTLAIARYLRI